MPSSHLNHQVHWWFEVQNGQKVIRVIQGKYFLWTMTSNSLAKNEGNDIPSQYLKTILDCMPQFFFRPQYVWFLAHLYVGLIPNSSGLLA